MPSNHSLRRSLMKSVFVVVVIASFTATTADCFRPGLNQPSTRTSQFFRSQKNDENDKTAEAPKEKDSELQTWNPLRLAVLKLKFTEPMWSSPLNFKNDDGSYACAACGNTLFDSASKYDSGSGWPSFWRSDRDGAIGYKRELDGRVECLCGNCRSHLGHVFPDGPLPEDVSENVEIIPESDPKSDSRYLPRFCMNGASLRFEERN